MKKHIFPHILLCALILLALNNASAQTPGLDSSSQQVALNNAKAFYAKTIDQQLPLYNGPEYYFYNPIELKGSAYFLDATFTPGNVFYDGAEYSGAPLLYDLYTDQLVSILYNHFSKYVLLNPWVQNFDLSGHHFINIDADTLSKNELIKTGYYDELYHGRSQVLAKRYKTIKTYSTTTGTAEAYSLFSAAKEDLFIKKDNVYYKADSEGQLLSVLKDKKKLLQQYI
ncbi:MAG: hypothetical protein ABI203_05110, partial [Mucilaginibacter sp.]